MKRICQTAPEELLVAAVEEEAYEEEEGAGGRAYADVDDDERQYAITLEQHR